MTRLPTLDKALLIVLVPLWAVCFTLSARWLVFEPTGHSPIYVSAARGADEYPSFKDFQPWSGAHSSGLQPGDRLLRAAETDLRGFGPIEFFALTARNGGGDWQLPLVYERAGKQSEILLPIGDFRVYWPQIPLSLAYLLTAVVVALRARPSPGVRAVFHSSLFLALVFGSYMPGSAFQLRAAIAIRGMAMAISLPLFLRLAALFPEGARPLPGWVRRLAWIFIVIWLLDVSGGFGFPIPPTIAHRVVYPVLAAFFATVLAIVTIRYRSAEPRSRRQFKWVLFGFYCALVPPILAAGLTLYDLRFAPVSIVSWCSLVLIPLSFLIAVLRYNLIDIDRLISATASYNFLLVLFVTAGLLIVPKAAQAAASLIGIGASTGQLVCSAGLAVLLVPVHRRLRPRIEQVFFPERHAFDHGVAELLTDVTACPNPQALMERVGKSLQRILRPDVCVVYGKRDHSYIPTFIEGRAIPPAFDARGSLVAALGPSYRPLVLQDGGGTTLGDLTLGAFDKAALQTLDAAVIMPVYRGEELFGFVCLGRKHSGDVYTPTDVSLLAAIAGTVSAELLRFDQSEVLDQARAMQERLRRYVPGAVAEQLTSGHELDARNRELSILFVDIRGYTSYSENRRAQEIFSTINRYTERVSEIIRGHGGSVVEFNGDGMMAVFGAPTDLPASERASVAAAREMVAAVPALHAGLGADEVSLAVGVGVATGQAFVGNIQAADRLIWTAIGNPVNLAARLQSLTRDLDAAIAIDAATYEGLDDAGAFECHAHVAIRGREQREDVYVLPLEA